MRLNDLPKSIKDSQSLKWINITSPADKEINCDKIIHLVGQAYTKTKMGSFIKTKQDVLMNNWYLLVDNDDNLSGVVGYRAARANESWQGYKINCMGHINTLESKKLIDPKNNKIELIDEKLDNRFIEQEFIYLENLKSISIVGIKVKNIKYSFRVGLTNENIYICLFIVIVYRP